MLIYCPSRSKHYCNITQAKRLVSLTILLLCIANGHILYGYEKIPLNLNETYDCYIREENIFYRNFLSFI